MKDLYKLIQEGKIKRFFRTRNKLSYPGLVSHITQRATGKEPLFIEKGDYLYMLKLLKTVSIDFSLDVFAFALLGNHCHILLQQHKKNLSDAMHNLFERYAKYFNSKYNRKGHVFGNRYGQAACFDDYYLLTISVYIHLNPVRAGMVDHYSQYRWTTWRLYCQEGEPVTFVNWAFIMKMIHNNYSEAKKRYRKLLEEAIKFRIREVMEEKRTIGKFSIWIRKRFPDFIKNPQISGGGLDEYDDGLSDVDLDKIIFELKDKKRLSRSMDIKARSFAAEQLRARGYDDVEIADYMGISRTTVYRIFSGKGR